MQPPVCQTRGRYPRLTVWTFLLAIAGLEACFCAPIAAQGWPDERTAGPFAIHSDAPLTDDALLLRELAALQGDVTSMLGISPPKETIHVFIFSRRSVYQRYLREYFPDAPYRKALYIKGRGPGMVFTYRSSDFEVDLRHECTHALLHAALPLVPLWLDEGLAEYFEAPPEQRAEGHSNMRPVQLGARFGLAPDLEDLEGLGDLSDMDRDEYRESWAWVHFMLHGPPEARDELVRFLADIAAHTPPGRLSRRLEHRLPGTKSRLVEHLRDW